MTNLSEQTQAYIHGEGEVAGDCWRTALACILEIPRDEVPHFAELHKNDPEFSSDWWWASVKFVQEVKPGWTLFCINPPVFPAYVFPTEAPQRVILTGRSPRGPWSHCVVADAITGEIVWDPHPSREGLLTKIEIAALTLLGDN